MHQLHLIQGRRRFGAVGIGLALITVAALATPGGAQDTEAPPAASDVTVEIALGVDFDRETRTLIGEGTDFAADGERVFCLTRVLGMTAPGSVTHAWYHAGKTMARVDLNVGSTDWRTWSSKRYLSTWTGDWEVKVLDESGKVLATAGFTVN